MKLDVDALNAPQRQAVLHEGGPLVVFAGAGSGKTRVITYRIAHLITERQVFPWRILATTFTNKAAQEMRARLERLVPGQLRDLRIGTFHALCAHLLRQHAESIDLDPRFTIYDGQDQKALVTRIMRDLQVRDKQVPVRYLIGRINQAKQELLTPEAIQEGTWKDRIVREVYANYEERLKAASALDFGGLIATLVQTLEQHSAIRDALHERFVHLLVDEFQDTNRAQYRLLQLLHGPNTQLCVVGDDDQSIYHWRGADRRNLLDFVHTFPKATIVKLEQNYRSSQRILRLANAVIHHNEEREPKALWTDNNEGEPIHLIRCRDEMDEAYTVLRAAEELHHQGHALCDMAIFYRTHAQSRVFEEMLHTRGIPYRVFGGLRFYERAEIKDALAYLRVLLHPHDDTNLLRIINTPARGIGKTTLNRLLDESNQQGSSVWQVLCARAEQGSGSSQAKLKNFVTLIRTLQQEHDEGISIDQLCDHMLELSGYRQVLNNEDSTEADARLQNLDELLNAMRDFVRQSQLDRSLSAFLERTSLQTAVDDTQTQDYLSLMTVHAAKGLEFPIVFVSGLEEQVFPHYGGEPYPKPEAIEEERRLAYVAFTRAEHTLMLSYAMQRRTFGKTRLNFPSRFIQEIPAEDLLCVDSQGQQLESSNLGMPIHVDPYAKYEGPSSSSYPASTSNQDSYVDFSEGDVPEGDSLQPGMSVRHGRFGEGRVTHVGLGLPARVTVDFEQHGRRCVLSTYLSAGR